MEQVKRQKGRPRTEEYRKIKHRMSRIEDVFVSVAKEISNEKDRKKVLQALETLKK